MQDTLIVPSGFEWVENLLTTLLQQRRGRAWNMSALPYSRSESITVLPNCFAFMFTNIGDTIARVNGMVIFPSTTPATALGDSRVLSGHLLDLYKGNITLAFQAPAGANPLVEIVQLFYHPTEANLNAL